MVTSAADINAQNAALISSIKNGTATEKKTDTKGLSGDYNTFLTLLTTQLKNQDPLNPTDTSEFTNQLVLYTQAEQQIKSNTKLDTLATLLQGNTNTQAIGYIGKDVTYAGSSVYNDGQKVDDIIYSLPSEASTMSLTIKDSEGAVVRTINYNTGSDEMTSGIHTFKWDGKDSSGVAQPAGSYTISASAKDSDGKAITASAVVKARVYGLETASDGTVSLILAGNRSIAMSAINSVQTPSVPDTTTSQQQHS